MLCSINPTKTECISYGNNKILAETEARADNNNCVYNGYNLNHTCSQCPLQESYVRVISNDLCRLYSIGYSRTVRVTVK